MLGALLRAAPGGKPLSATELRGHVLGLFLAGNETTGAALSWALVHAAAHPAAWATLRSDPDRYVGPYVDETLRLTPAVWGIPRVPARRGLSLTCDGVVARIPRYSRRQRLPTRR